MNRRLRPISLALAALLAACGAPTAPGASAGAVLRANGGQAATPEAPPDSVGRQDSNTQSGFIGSGYRDAAQSDSAKTVGDGKA